MTTAAPQPLISLLPFQQESFGVQARICYFLWRRQAGKSYTIAAKAIDRMMAKPGRSCFFVSASISTGKELIEKEAAIWHDALGKLRQAQEALGKELGGNVVDRKSHQLLDVDALADLIEKQTAQIKIYHSRTSYSRTKIIAPNPDTARGWTGDVFGDEIGFWPDYRGVWDAVEPIISRNPDFIFWLYTTPPEDDSHYTYDLLDPGVRQFTPNPRGNWYKTESGYPVHRADVYDCELAGLPLYSPMSGKPVDYATYRAQSQDKSAADRNYALMFVQGGASAVQLAWINRAQRNGLGCCEGIDLAGQDIVAAMIADLIGVAWRSSLQGGRIALGLDVASTTNKLSNPSALTVMEQHGGKYYERLVARWKTDDYDVMLAIALYIIGNLPREHVAGMSVDISNEKFAGNKLRKDLAGRITVVGIAGNSKVRWQGEDSDAKTAMGAAYCDALETGVIAMPPLKWISDDHRLVTRNGAKYDADVDKAGNHADTFDSSKHAYWMLVNPARYIPLPHPVHV